MTLSAITNRLRSHRADLLSALLIVSLLFVQWSGLTHAVAHAGNTAIVSADAAESSMPAGSGGFDHQKSASSCAALDAATLGVALPSPSFPTVLQSAVAKAITQAATTSWITPFRAHFSPRAPPLKA
jgi:hypothetical protein